MERTQKPETRTKDMSRKHTAHPAVSNCSLLTVLGNPAFHAPAQAPDPAPRSSQESIS